MHEIRLYFYSSSGLTGTGELPEEYREPGRFASIPPIAQSRANLAHRSGWRAEPLPFLGGVDENGQAPWPGAFHL